jgi:hypothetical protein
MARPLTQEQVDFLHAIEQYKKKNDKLFLSWTEVLSIVKAQGYTRTVAKRNSNANTANTKSTTKKSPTQTEAKAKSTTSTTKSKVTS